jgi:chromosome partitioning protein
VIVTVANQKGGVGKTTTSVFLAHALAAATGAPCSLIDADPQASAATWAQRSAEAGHPLPVPVLAYPTNALAAVLPDTPHVVIDTPPAAPDILGAAIRLADLVLVPTSPSTLDLSRVQATVDAAVRAGIPAVVLLTRTRRTRSVGEAETTLRAAGLHVLNTHVPLREAVAMAFGHPVRELHGYDLVTAELLGALPEQPFSVEAVRARATASGVAVPEPMFTGARHAGPLPTVAVTPSPALTPMRAASIGPNDDELIARLKTSMARLAANA